MRVRPLDVRSIANRPPSASTRSRSPVSRTSGPARAVVISKARAVRLPHSDRDPVLGMVDDLEAAEVDGRQRLGRTVPSRSDLDHDGDLAARGGDPDRRPEVARLEERRVDRLCEPGRLLQRLLHVAFHLVEERLRRGGVGVR